MNDTILALQKTARERIEQNKVDEALHISETLIRLTPKSEDAWRLYNDCLRKVLDWQIHLQNESDVVNESLRKITHARAELSDIMCEVSRSKKREAPAYEDNFLQELTKKYRPSKRVHNYIPHYWRHFHDIRHKVTKVCEIGLADHPGEKHPDSLMMWEEFFPNATIYGMDINPECSRFEGGRRKIFIGDQADPEFLQYFIKKTGGGLDIIIDDGAHTTSTILTSFTWLFGALSDHGIYVIEDLCHQRRVHRFLLDLADGVNHWPTGFPFPDWPYLKEFEDSTEWVRKNITGVAFYRFITFIMRGYSPEDNPYLRDKPKTT